jgi:hypothetical protein
MALGAGETVLLVRCLTVPVLYFAFFSSLLAAFSRLFSSIVLVLTVLVFLCLLTTSCGRGLNTIGEMPTFEVER